MQGPNETMESGRGGGGGGKTNMSPKDVRSVIERKETL